MEDIVVRLAKEGVPVGVIARALNVSSDELYPILKEAKDLGQIDKVPPYRWQEAGSAPEELDVLEVRVLLNRKLKLTKFESVVIAEIYRTGFRTKEQILNHLNENVTDKIADVYVCKARKKLDKLGIVVNTIWGVGWQMDADNRAKIKNLLTQPP